MSEITSEQGREAMKQFQDGMHRLHTATNVEVTSQSEKALHKEMNTKKKTLLELGLECVDQAMNDADPLGDGDQSFVRADVPTDPGQRLRELWCEGGAEGGLNTLVATSSLPALYMSCLMGDAQSVSAAIAATDSDSPERSTLLESRVSVLRLTPMMVTIIGARSPPIMMGRGGSVPVPGDYMAVVDALCAAGARVDAKDLAGYSAAHHCTTGVATALTLAIYRLLATKYKATLTRNRFNDYSVYEAIMARREDVLHALIDNGAKFDSLATSMTVLWQEGLKCLSWSNMYHRARVLGKGDSVKLVYLTGSLEELKGKLGTLGDLDYHTGLFSVDVSLEDGSIRVVKVGRHYLEYAACETCRTVCSRKCVACKLVCYCSKECQKADWKKHKVICRKISKSDKKNCEVLKVPNQNGQRKHYWVNKLKEAEIAAAKNKKVKGDQCGEAGYIEFIVKVQASVFNPRHDLLLVYNKNKSFNAQVSSTESMFQLMNEHADNPLKTFMMCKYHVESDTGYIEISKDNLHPHRGF